MALNDRRRRLLDSERWRSLASFVARWYARALSDEDGHTPFEIETAERRLGTRLPAALVEWLELVGRRLCFVQDIPTPLDEITIEDGSIRVWTENQGVWSVYAPNDGDDPVAFATDDAGSSPDAALSRTLLGLLVSDTLVGAWAGRRVGILGDLRASVRGGYCDTFSDEAVVNVEVAFPPLDHVRSPSFEMPLRGNDDAIIRRQDVAIEWMTATHAAFAALDAILGLR